MTYSIAETARRTGLSIDTLRYYERIELIDAPARDSGGRRTYSEQDLAWIGFLMKMRSTGMPIRMLREYAKLRHQGIASSTPRKQLLIEHRKAVVEQIAELNACLEILDYKIANYADCERRMAEQLPEFALDVPQEVSA
ncbi:MerR family transcriptional regulator [Herbihabitans rhizosphaerae]|uniref:MerR family transcriptional regulator n=1 Tax=Herbihabitans rhizosphaerae TaxID=1872711 RepID=A0A4Q7KKS4_9PSEU|nr:MerR family transcriptional regulator [Herbihabitans rhizosphaerae]RZS36814.1 MerR family transcriptional regulator [Herbihabitans rhizosphaerae]